jgi:hypothetical protein
VTIVTQAQVPNTEMDQYALYFPEVAHLRLQFTMCQMHRNTVRFGAADRDSGENVGF